MAGPASVPILTYHSLDDSGSVISVAPGVFRRHMDLLRERGFQGIALGDLLDGWEGRTALPSRPVVLTFDDGFLNVAEHAAPVLDGLGFRATIFVVAGYCGATNDWPTQSPRVPRLPLCSWSDLVRLSDGSFEIGLHGFNHTPLDGAAPEVERSEIVAAKRLVEERLGRAVRAFAYPYGVASPAARELVRQHYRGACSTRLAVAHRDDERHWLGRIDAYYLRRPWLFRLLATPLGDIYLGLRACGRAVRAALLGGDVRSRG